jgi:AcrR family transcriptional regulator
LSTLFQERSAVVTRSSEPGLRERQRTAVRAEIQRAALTLFAEKGLEAVTTEAIAERAGVSASTLFRYVPNKEHLLLGVAQHEGSKIIANFRGRPRGEDLADSLAAAILARTSQLEGDDETLELWRRAMASSPSALRRASLLSRDDCDELIRSVAERLDDTTAGADLRAGVLVRASLAAAEYAYEWWLSHPETETLHVLTARALGLVAHDLAHPRSGITEETL